MLKTVLHGFLNLVRLFEFVGFGFQSLLFYTFIPIPAREIMKALYDNCEKSCIFAATIFEIVKQ